jgi:phage FluMu gp28-like protein
MKKGQIWSTDKVPAFVRTAIQQYCIKNLRIYQKKFLADKSRYRIANKSRQIGFSFLSGLEMIIGSLINNKDQLIVSASKDNAVIVMNHVRSHLKAMGIEAFNDTEHEILMPNGKSIKALATNWMTARGFAGDVYLDEFAFIIQDREVWKAIIPAITAAQGRVTVISTPKSRIDKFWEIWDKNDAFSKHLITIHTAKEEGLDINVDELRSLFTPEEFAQAYECLPLDTTDSYIPYKLIEPCLYVNEHPTPEDTKMFYAADIGRKKDETAITGAFINDDKLMVVNYIKDLKRETFAYQKEFFINLIRQSDADGFAIDRGGIGYNLWEDLSYLYPNVIEGYSFAPAVKERLAKRLKRGFEDKKLLIPNDPSLLNHILSIKRSANRTNIFSYNAESTEHHGDKFWSLAMLYDLRHSERVIDGVMVV